MRPNLAARKKRMIDQILTARAQGEAMSKEKKSAADQVADEAKRRALNPLASRQTISNDQAEPEFQENHKRLRADRQARESAALKAKK